MVDSLYRRAMSELRETPKSITEIVFGPEYVRTITIEVLRRLGANLFADPATTLNAAQPAMFIPAGVLTTQLCCSREEPIQFLCSHPTISRCALFWKLNCRRPIDRNKTASWIRAPSDGREQHRDLSPNRTNLCPLTNSAGLTLSAIFVDESLRDIAQGF
jgi:hypothetical protein